MWTKIKWLFVTNLGRIILSFVLSAIFLKMWEVTEDSDYGNIGLFFTGIFCAYISVYAVLGIIHGISALWKKLF